jgi:tetratricopeptide (TPR) repeat protein
MRQNGFAQGLRWVSVGSLVLAWIWVALAAAGVELPAQLAAARAASARGETLRAVELYETVVRALPENLHVAAEYRQQVLRVRKYDRALALFEELAGKHPRSANVALSFAMAHVDKLPDVGKLSQVGMANKARAQFERAVALEASWLALHSLGNVEIYYPRFFGHTESGLKHLEQALALAARGPAREYHALSWAALGDGHWRLGQVDKARQLWLEGGKRFPTAAVLEARLSRQGEALDRFLSGLLRPETRVSTSLEDVRRDGWQEACACDPSAGLATP